MLTHYEDKYARLYLRIINETPRGLIFSFMEHEHLDPNTLEDIYNRLNERGFDLRDFGEL
jgi:hypothetical protein